MIFDIQPCKLYNHQTHLGKPPRTPKSKLDTAVAKPVPSKGGCLATRIHCQAELLQRSYSPSPFLATNFFEAQLIQYFLQILAIANLFLPYTNRFRPKSSGAIHLPQCRFQEPQGETQCFSEIWRFEKWGEQPGCYERKSSNVVYAQ